jgi:hypothetical protein
VRDRLAAGGWESNRPHPHLTRGCQAREKSSHEPPHLAGFSVSEFAAIRARVGRGVSDRSRMARVAVSTIHHWEAGTRSPQVDILASVMEAPGAPIEAVVLIPADQ